MLCPTCKTPLSIADRTGIEIDYCPACRGVWLERGELDKIIERSAATSGAGTSSGRDLHFDDRGPRQQHRHGDEQHGKRRRKSFLSDIFDV